jgi:hypothetical protein
VEDLTDAGNHADLWSNTDADAIRMPVGWHGTHLVDQAGYNACGGPYGSNFSGVCEVTAASYHVIDATSGSRIATVCETPAGTPSGTYDNEFSTGLPTSAGVTCSESEFQSTATTQTSHYSMYAVDWAGVERSFFDKTTSNGPDGGFPASNCSLSPEGSRMACTDPQSNTLTLLTRDGKTHSVGRRYEILGWIDATHLLVDVDSMSLAVLSPDGGAETAVPMAQADKVEMRATLPGSL